MALQTFSLVELLANPRAAFVSLPRRRRSFRVIFFPTLLVRGGRAFGHAHAGCAHVRPGAVARVTYFIRSRAGGLREGALACFVFPSCLVFHLLCRRPRATATSMV